MLRARVRVRVSLRVKIKVRVSSSILRYPVAGPQSAFYSWPTRTRVVALMNKRSTHTHTPFTVLLDFVWDYPGEPAPQR